MRGDILCENGEQARTRIFSLSIVRVGDVNLATARRDDFAGRSKFCGVLAGRALAGRVSITIKKGVASAAPLRLELWRYTQNFQCIQID